MNAMQGLVDGFAAAISPVNLFWLMIGVVTGTLVGILPGLGPPATIAILLPLATNLDPSTGLIMMAGIYYGAKYGGSTTSILLNIPGESSSVVTCLDGYEMAKQGRAGPALGMAAIASFVAGTVGVLGLTFLAPVVANVAVEFGPPEYTALMAFALVLVIMLAGESLLKGFISMVLGLLLSTVGVDLFSGAQRYTFGTIELAGGLEFIALSIGVFAIGEVLVNVEEKTGRSIFTVPSKIRELLPSREDLRRSRGAIAQGSVSGFLIGTLPGAGATVASFVSYTIARRFSKHRKEFGKGAVEGVAAPEAANNSETGGAMIPLLTLGIPGSSTGAVMLGALVLYGLQPGPLLFTDHPEVAWPVIASMYLGNVALLILNLPLVPFFARLLKLPYWVMYPGILVISVVGVYSVNGSLFDVWMLAVFGLLGYVLKKLEIPPAPLLLAFVLGPIAEDSIRQSLIISANSPLIFLERPISAVLIGLAVLVLLSLTLGKSRRLRRKVLEIDD
ncbi:MAG: tripartite tricarboxylate transporter permease [Actinophytocola sp.]|uniref:tripartite tricarboxylate transporter permease n=1 Tax=Actinophytocola sp. TaxID=1872138 RepID=UPI001326FCDB|nr:tripartite tricarboxylate transporter permease [Actinophytocola sp.]MPZ83756.1 tripartite tricarboxylate transporter permease [Actinophytocola sp.]